MVRNRSSSSYAPNAENCNDDTDEQATTNAARTVASSASSIGLSNGFALPDFIVPTVMEYLGIHSLVRFGTVCKDHRGLVSIEVERRKAHVAEIEVEVMQLMRNVETPSGGVYCERHMRANVKVAQKMARRALRLIDDEINYRRMFRERNPKFPRGVSTWEEYAVAYGKYDFFFHERKKFLRLPTVGSLYIFPNEFYFSPVGEVIQVSEEKINALTGIVSRRWETIRHCSEDNYSEKITDFANRLGNGQPWYIDAYQIAARKVLVSLPYSRAREQAHPDKKALSYFSCILHKAFDIVTRNRLRQYLCDLKCKVDASQFISAEDKMTSHALTDGAIKWMEENPDEVRANYHAKGFELECISDLFKFEC